MHEWKPVTERVARIREKYRTTRPKIDINRYRLVTEFYMENPQITGILKRAKNLSFIIILLPVTFVITISNARHLFNIFK